VPPEVWVPDPLQRALERGICTYSHLTVSASIPVVGPPGVRMEVRPPRGVYAWRLFAFVFGSLEPAGVSEDFVVTHIGPRTIKHEDPWVHSIVDPKVYPLTETITRAEPHVLWITNQTPETQTFDITLHYMEFKRGEDYDLYRAMVEESWVALRELKRIRKRAEGER